MSTLRQGEVSIGLADADAAWGQMELSWAAGLFNGSGVISYSTSDRLESVSVRNLDKESAGKFSNAIIGGIRTSGRAGFFGGFVDYNELRDSYDWTSGRQDVYAVLRVLRPYLVGAKLAEVEQALTTFADE